MQTGTERHVRHPTKIDYQFFTEKLIIYLLSSSLLEAWSQLGVVPVFLTETVPICHCEHPMTPPEGEDVASAT